MRAERSRGSRIRSPSWRNELIKKIFVKKPGSAGLFLFYLVAFVRQLEHFLFVPRFALGDSIICRMAGLRNLGGRAFVDPAIVRARFGNSNRDNAAPPERPSGLPCSDDQKKTRLHSHLSA
jgi:hypothetical protein